MQSWLFSVCCGPYRLLCGGGVPCGGKHIIINVVHCRIIYAVHKSYTSYVFLAWSGWGGLHYI